MRDPPLLERATPPTSHVDPDREWCDLASLVWVECERRCGDRVATDTRCFISSLPPRARPLLQAVRQHWSIENAHHWVLDVAFGEDDSRIRTGYAAHNGLADCPRWAFKRSHLPAHRLPFRLWFETLSLSLVRPRRHPLYTKAYRSGFPVPP